MHDFTLPALVTLGIVVLLFVLAFNVGRQRGIHKIDAPAMTGHPMLERAIRVQMNTIESVLLLLPLMWIYAAFGNPKVAALMGGLWIAARIWYARAYMADPGNRSKAFAAGLLAIVVLFIGAAWSVVARLV
ncbi:MAG: MAPEG family protein [Rhodocyclaceae bacterium]|jgi:glutathione S-transferase|nr:MAPEG family protein [Rhodocyclaceae bacterium]